MALTEEELEEIGRRMASYYQELEQNTIADIARRVKKTGRYTETAELMVTALREQGVSPARIRTEVMKLLRADAAYQKAVAENTVEYKRYVASEIRRITEEAREEGNRIVADAGMMSFNRDLSAWEAAGKSLSEPGGFAQLLEAMAKQTDGELRNLTRSLGFKGMGFTPLEQAYQHQMDLGLIKLTSGAYSWQQVVNDCVRELAQSGLRTIDFKSGRSMQLDTAARNAIMTASGQLSGRITMLNLGSTGETLVEVAAHWGARSDGSRGHADHAYWQGKVYAIDKGKHRKEGRRLGYKILNLEEATGYPSDPLGLHGYNCRHTMYPFFEGISEPNVWDPEPDPVTVNGREYTYYEATQRQRQMERQIRATKREIEAQNALGGDTAELRSRLKKQTSDYKSFSAEVGIRPKNERLRVQPGTSDITKTKVWENASKSRARRETAERIFSVQPVEKGDVILAENIYKDLKRSDVGRSVIKFFEETDCNVEIIYNRDTIQEYGLSNVYGLRLGNNVYINAINCGTKKMVVDTIIHEKTHLDYPEENNRHIECVCDAMAVLRRKGSLTGDDLRSIIKSVNDRYAELSWR